MLCRGGVVSPQRHPRGAVAGDGRSILNAVGRLKLGVALEAEDTAASILPRAGKEVAERGQTLERRQLVDDAIEAPVAIGRHAHDRADGDVEQYRDQRAKGRKKIGLDVDSQPNL